MCVGLNAFGLGGLGLLAMFALLGYLACGRHTKYVDQEGQLGGLDAPLCPTM